MTESDAKIITFTGVPNKPVAKLEVGWHRSPDTTVVTGTISPKAKTQRPKNPGVQARRARICAIGRPIDVALPEYVRGLGRSQSPFETPKSWQAKGCPRWYPEAYKKGWESKFLMNARMLGARKNEM